jgi:putative ABC transport system permease protein
MILRDTAHFAWQALTTHRLRTIMMLLATAIGVTSVIFLTNLGDAARRYVTHEFMSIGSNLVLVFPGRNETTGGMPPVLAETPRDLTIEDALYLNRSPHIRRLSPVNFGVTELYRGRLSREATVLGVTAAYFDIVHLGISEGTVLPVSAPNVATPLCVIGNTLRQELFGPDPAIGEWVLMGDRRFRIVGVLAPKGKMFGLDFDEAVILPTASAQQLFNTDSLSRIAIEANGRESIELAKQDILRLIRERHDGEDDVTVITQDALVSSFDSILGALTYAVGGIASISLLVAGVLIMNIMYVTVSQRTQEIGLLMALGAAPHVVLHIFLLEAMLLGSAGALLGLLLGLAGCVALHLAYPVLSAAPPLWAIITALSIAIGTGALFGVLPARRASRLNPVDALQRRQ